VENFVELQKHSNVETPNLTHVIKIENVEQKTSAHENNAANSAAVSLRIINNSAASVKTTKAFEKADVTFRDSSKFIKLLPKYHQK